MGTLKNLCKGKGAADWELNKALGREFIYHSSPISVHAGWMGCLVSWLLGYFVTWLVDCLLASLLDWLLACLAMLLSLGICLRSFAAGLYIMVPLKTYVSSIAFPFFFDCSPTQLIPLQSPPWLGTGSEENKVPDPLTPTPDLSNERPIFHACMS